MWHDGIRALGPVDGLDLRGKTDGQLLLMRATHDRLTAWAPRYVGESLGSVRRLAESAGLDVTRSDAEAEVAEARGDAATAERHRQRAAASAKLESVWRQQEPLMARRTPSSPSTSG